jgi:hypothetical protein
VGFVVDKVALGQVFSEYFGFPCHSSFHQLLHNHPQLSSGAFTTGQKWLQYPTPLKKLKNKDKGSSKILSRFRGDYRRGFGFVLGFIDHVNTRLVVRLITAPLPHTNLRVIIIINSVNLLTV